MAAPMKIVRSASSGPTAAPTNAISVTSPNPIASFRSAASPSQPTIAIAPAPTHAPRTAVQGPTNGPLSPMKTPVIDAARRKRKPVTVKPSGIVYVRRSVTAMPSSSVANTARRSAVNVGPYALTDSSQMTAVVSSIEGYSGEMGSEQPRQRPRNSSQLSTGTLSYQAIPALQRGHRDRGLTTLSPAGQRVMQTLRNDPTQAPTSAA